MPKLKDLPKIEYPREKIAKYGPEKLLDHELLAILLRSGTKGVNVLDLSKKILHKFTKEKLPTVSFKDLKNTFGLGAAKAAEIMACFELGRRMLNGKQSVLIMSPKDVWENAKDIRDNRKEHFVVFYLDTRNQEIKRETISVGTLNASLIHPREVFEPAIRHTAAQVIFAHNHPSGNTEPSADDIETTRRLAHAGKILGIEVLDHVIVTKDKWESLKEKGIV